LFFLPPKGASAVPVDQKWDLFLALELLSALKKLDKNFSPEEVLGDDGLLREEVFGEFLSF